jgi:hypothetical protein
MDNLKLDFLALCDFAMTSAEGKLSIIGIFDRMFVRDVPSSFLRFFIVAIVRGESDSTVKITYLVKTPSKKEALNPKEIMVKIGSSGKANLTVDVANFPLPEVGEYQLIIKADGKELGSTLFYVSKVNTSDPSAKKIN